MKHPLAGAPGSVAGATRGAYRIGSGAAGVWSTQRW